MAATVFDHHTAGIELEKLALPHIAERSAAEKVSHGLQLQSLWVIPNAAVH